MSVGAATRYSYEDVEAQVQAYKRGEEGAAAELINMFQGYLVRWLLVLTGQAAFSDKYHRQFVSLYVRNRGRRMRILNGDYRGINDFLYWSGVIRERYQDMPRDEKWNALVLCLLELARRYSPWDGVRDYHTYVMRSFPYYLHRHLEEYAGDMSSFSQIVVPLAEQPDYEDGQPDVAIPATVDDTALDAAWVAGSTAGDGFAALTPLERQILLYYYRDHYNDREIAERLGVGRCSVNRRRIRARRRLRAALEGTPIGATLFRSKGRQSC